MFVRKIRRGDAFGITLVELSVFGNQLKQIQGDIWRGLDSLKILELFHNHISTIKHGDFDNLPSLQKLDLVNNGLNVLESGAFSNLFSIKRIYLDNNNLRTIAWSIFNPSDFKAMGGHPSEMILSLSGNPLQCDQNLCWLQLAKDQGWMEYTRDDQIVTSDLTCGNLPHKELGRSFLQCPHTGTVTCILDCFETQYKTQISFLPIKKPILTFMNLHLSRTH